MSDDREEGGEHSRFLFQLLLLLIQKTPEGGATVGDIRKVYESSKKGNIATEKIIQRAIRRINIIFDPNAADKDPVFRTPRNQLPVRATITTFGGERVRRFTFHRQLAPEREASTDKAAQALLQLYPQQRQMQTEDFEKLFDLVASNLGQHGASGDQLRSNIEKFIFVSGFTPAESRQNLQKMVQIFQAYRRKKRVRFHYTGASTGEKSVREVYAYGMVSRHGVWYLVGHCLSANSVRIFRIDHIARLTIMENSTYTVPADYSHAKKYGSLWGIWTESEKPPGTERVLLHVSAPIASHFDTVRYHTSQTVQKNPDGSMEVCFNVGGAQEMVPWLMGWGEHVKVLEPAWLRNEVVGCAKRLLQQYE